jgi:chemotaxis protein histidine kinase CheA
MEYREIVSVTGIGGLYQLLSTKSDGAIVRNLADNTTKFISARLHNVTPLESIEIYTIGNNVRLHEVLDQMQKSEKSKPDAKKASNDEIRSYFKEVYPDIDEDRVYVSDMKKMLKWFDLLKSNNLLDFSSLNRQQEDAAAGDADADAQVAEKEQAENAEDVALIADEKPAKKAKAKKAAAEPADGEEKPAKKAAKKKKEDDEVTVEGEEKPAKKAATRKKKED